MESNKSNRKKLDKILKKYKLLLNILENNGDDRVFFAIRELRIDIKNIEELLAENDIKTDYTEILKLLKANYKRLYPVRGGLTEFYIGRKDPKERVLANKPLSIVKEELNKIFESID